MRRIFLFLLVATGSLLISSCLTIQERISLNADGSGTHTNTVDFSTLMENPMVKMGLAEEMKKKGGGEIPQRVDSTFSVVDGLLAHNEQWTAAEVELLSRVNGKMTMDLVDGIGIVETTFPFESPDEIRQMTSLLANANKPEEGADANPFAGMSGTDFLVSMMTMKGTKFTRTTTKSPDFENPLDEAGLDESTMSMMQEMFGDAVVSYRIDFPGAIKKVKGFPGHELEGDNSIIVLFDFMEMMNDPEVMAKALTGEIKFKK